MGVEGFGDRGIDPSIDHRCGHRSKWMRGSELLIQDGLTYDPAGAGAHGNQDCGRAKSTTDEDRGDQPRYEDPERNEVADGREIEGAAAEDIEREGGCEAETQQHRR